MVILNGQKNICSLSGKEIKKEEEFIYFPNIIVNARSPLYGLNDSFILKNEIEKSVLKDEINQYLNYDEFLNSADINKDYITGEELRLSNFDNPDNLVQIGILSLDEKSEVYKYNGVIINKMNVPSWQNKNLFIADLNSLNCSENWGGNYIGKLFNRIFEQPIAPPLKEWMLKDIENRIKEGAALWWMKL